MAPCDPSFPTTDCSSPSYDPSQRLDVLLYNGPYDPQHYPMVAPYENFTVQVPDFAVSQASLIATHFFLAGVSFVISCCDVYARQRCSHKSIILADWASARLGAEIRGLEHHEPSVVRTASCTVLVLGLCIARRILEWEAITHCSKSFYDYDFYLCLLGMLLRFPYIPRMTYSGDAAFIHIPTHRPRRHAHLRHHPLCL